MISWKEYWTLMSLGLVFYYGWLLFKYFPTLRLRGNDTGKGSRKDFIVEEFKTIKKRVPDVTGQPKEVVSMNTVESEKEMESKEVLLHRAVAQGQPAPEIKPQPDGLVTSPGKETPLPSPQLELPEPVGKSENMGPLAENLAKEIKELIRKAAENKVGEGQVIFSLQKVLGKEEYKELKGSFFETGISEMIGSMLVRECSIHLDAAMLQGLWVR